MKNTNYIKPVAIGVAIGGLILLLTSGKSSSAGTPVLNDTVIPDETTPAPPTVDPNKVVAKGSRGLEVKELQRLMNITADGIFGSQTEARLYALKGVKKASINQYKKLPSINQNILAIGTKVMANINFSTPTNLYEAIKKADGTYESNYQVATDVDYGEEVGTIQGANGTGSWYLIIRNTWLGEKRYFVKAAEVKKI